MGHYLSEMDEETYKKHYPPPKRYFNVFFMHPGGDEVWQLAPGFYPQEIDIAKKTRDDLSYQGYETMILETRCEK